MSDRAADDALVVYADYVCPFCYLGKATLDRYRASRDDPLDVEWRPFDLRAGKRGPDGELRPDADDGKDEAYYERAKRNVERLKAEYDVEMSLALSLDVDSWNAHQATLWVRRNADDETVEAFVDGVFEALWTDERDVGDPDVLAEVAVDAGLDPTEIREAVADEDLADVLRRKFAASASGHVTGVPTFVYGDDSVRGAVPPEDLAALVDGE